LEPPAAQLKRAQEHAGYIGARPGDACRNSACRSLREPIIRTSAALKAAKARGKRLGNPKLSDARRHAAAARKESADRYLANVLPVITEYDGAGSNRCAARDGALEERELNVRDFAAALLRYSVEYRTSV
jgi:hypothetical protein